jgi:hypothetical protein
MVHEAFHTVHLEERKQQLPQTFLVINAFLVTFQVMSSFNGLSVSLMGIV